jgi:uncharacterized alpha-E superfamily protein
MTLLSRTADNLYWLARYMERAETAARLLDVGARNALLPNTGGGYRNEWDAVLAASGGAAMFAEKYGDPVQRNIETFLFFDRDNPASVASCLGRARENGRIVRTALSGQVWDSLNSAFQDLRAMERQERSTLQLSDLTDWTRKTTALVRGGIEGTLLRRDGYHFLNLGYALERADNTARLLDVKYYVLLPHVSLVGSGLDAYQWETLLRAMSAHRAFYWAYGGDLTPRKIADFLILNPAMPRSLLTCVIAAADHLEHLARGYGQSTPAQTTARALHAELAEMTVEEIFDEGLHEFLTRFILRNGDLGVAVHESYLSGDVG